MQAMVFRRILIGFATLWVVSIIVYFGLSVLPGDAAAIQLGQAATEESLAALRAQLGLDRPAYVRYFEWLGNMSTGDLGISNAGGATIASLIVFRLGNTLGVLWRLYLYRFPSFWDWLPLCTPAHGSIGLSHSVP